MWSFWNYCWIKYDKCWLPYANKIPVHSSDRIFNEPAGVFLSFLCCCDRHTFHLCSFLSPGYSDPYCMLGILVGQSPRELEDKKERKFSFRKRKEKLEKRSSTKEALPARCIQVTEVKPETLNPVWDEHFVLWVETFLMRVTDMMMWLRCWNHSLS